MQLRRISSYYGFIDLQKETSHRVKIPELLPASNINKNKIVRLKGIINDFNVSSYFY